jgi:hypothetical protein
MFNRLKRILSEVQEPLSQGEKNFKHMHDPSILNLVPGVTDQEHVFKGTMPRKDPKTASYEGDKSTEVYDKNLKVQEEAEQIDELSKKTLGSYMKRATSQLGFAADYEGKRNKETSNAIGKRFKGLHRAIDKLTKEEAEQIDESEKKLIHKVLVGGQFNRSHGSKNFDKIEDAKQHAEKVKRDLNRRYQNSPYTPSISIVSEQTDYSEANSHGPYDRGSADADYGRKYEPHKFVDNGKGGKIKELLTDPKEIAQYKKGYTTGGTDKKDFSEQIDEGKRGLWNNIHAKRKRIEAGSRERMRKPGSEGAPTDKDFENSKKSIKESSHNETEGGAEKNIINQLNKRPQGDYHVGVSFSNGKKADVHVRDANKIRSLHLNAKTAKEKEEIQDMASDSHESLKKLASTGKVEIEKPESKVSLGSMRKEELQSDSRNFKLIVVTGPDGRPKFVKRKEPRKDIGVNESEEMNSANVAKAAATQTKFGVVGNRNMQQDSIDNIQKDPLASKQKVVLPPTQGNKPIGGDTQTHANIAEEVLLDKLYKSLSEENKMKFVVLAKTEEGTEKLIHFAKEQDL